MKAVVNRKGKVSKVNRSVRTRTSSARKTNKKKVQKQETLMQFPSYPRIFHFML